MTRRSIRTIGTTFAIATALAAASPRPASADRLVFTTMIGETGAYLSPWDTMEPFTTFGLQFLDIDYDFDLIFGGTYGHDWGGYLVDAGTVSFDARFRLHGSVNDYDLIFPYFLWGASYRHLWAQGAPAIDATPNDPAVPATWITRSGFDVSLGGGYFLLSDGFYFDFLVRGFAGLMWPEASWNAGIAMELGFGFYLD